MVQKSIHRLEDLCNFIPDLIASIPESEFSFKPSPKAWSKKEILGHLIDSATNNHQRFIRGQFEDTPFISYDTDRWNAAGYYNTISSVQLIKFWQLYNLHLAAILKQIPKHLLKRNCKTGDNAVFNLEFLAEDYVVHLEHHLHQIVSYT